MRDEGRGKRTERLEERMKSVGGLTKPIVDKDEKRLTSQSGMKRDAILWDWKGEQRHLQPSALMLYQGLTERSTTEACCVFDCRNWYVSGGKMVENGV